MKHIRWLVALVAGAFVLAACGGLQSGAPDAEVQLSSANGAFLYEWDGIKGRFSEECSYDRLEDGWIHWVFATKGRADNGGGGRPTNGTASIELFVDGESVGTFDPAEPLNAAVWHFVTPFYDLDTLEATVTLDREKGPGVGLVISDWCDREGATLEVKKTVETTFTRDHFWDIAKFVETENNYVIGEDETPKIWLSIDGEGDETATWNVDVTYMGSVDSELLVSGDITIKNISTGTKTIDSVTDTLYKDVDGAGTLVPIEVLEVDCFLGDPEDEVPFDIPDTLESGQIVTCLYSYSFDSAGDVPEFGGWNEVEVTVEGEDKLYGDDVPWAFDFDDPTEENNKSITIEDDSDLFDEPLSLGTLSADDFPCEADTDDWLCLEAVNGEPRNTARFTYDELIEYADYAIDPGDECEPVVINNTATIVETEQYDTAKLKINVQCFVFKGETVTGAGEKWSELDGAPATWFEYTPVPPYTADLIQGAPRNVVGSVAIYVIGVSAELCFTLTEFPEGTPWELDESKAENVKIEPLAVQPTSWLEPGGYSEKFTLVGDDAVSPFCVTVPLGDYGYAIHLDAGFWTPDPNFGP